jgi:hypothetical protein
VVINWQPSGKWINLEQDLGNKFLAKAKSSYHPERMGQKWLLASKNDACNTR